ncbi:filamentous hemagglutinin N-terminal domain-containing protein [Caballeronia sp. ATUFL_M2_KS44]|uniref:two-partner secretion domain-containing protein n=1 Tax=Caballeronia sp. ATUFL_M2_KS44 TaxID=2921767 RepID=UPI00202852CA|nr:filamentous hemagglutinin N-terminal domain-containing protein [Caballeronia sp. ATUFL_M2_KS44]
MLATQPGVSFAQALPTGGQVTAGQASISQNTNTMTINQGSQRTVIDWNSFNVGAGNTVQFNQPNAQSQALNRVSGGGASNIQGSLLANGQVLIQNANGVLFGKGSVVNVGSLLATTKAINPDAFMAGGTLQLNSTGTNASVVNDGSIQAQGYVTLVGDQVRNTGSINTAQGGQVVLAAGDSATVALPNGQGIQLTLTNATANALVENSGTIKADNGSVLLTARGTNTLLSTVVNLSGVVRAGTVVADAGNTGDVAVTGKIDASNNAAGGVGGTVVLSGDRVGVFGNASIDASGDVAGGKVIIGDRQRRAERQRQHVERHGCDRSGLDQRLRQGFGRHLGRRQERQRRSDQRRREREHLRQLDQWRGLYRRRQRLDRYLG